MRKTLFVAPKYCRVIVSPAVVMNCRMLDVQHLMKDDVLDDETRDIRCVQGFADDYRLVCRVVMGKDPICLLCGPGQDRFGQLPGKIPVLPNEECYCKPLPAMVAKLPAFNLTASPTVPYTRAKPRQ